MKQRNFFQSKVSHNFVNLLDIDNILDNNAENIFFKNVSIDKKLDSEKKEKNKNSDKLSDYLKSGHLDYSLDSNSKSNKEEQQKNKNEQKKPKKQNFILKSELFNSSPDNDRANRSGKVSPKSSVLK